ncbi:MAG: short-chain dehydrogenase [Deltaproteobacteria bacterium]|nr:short-chain dehydrogenase [Deltaproteobacteria bacterium]
MKREQFLEHFGPWAVVTGASSGIGTGFAEQLAAAGLNLVLVARRGETLEAIGERLSRAHGIEVRAVTADLSTADGIERTRRALAEVEVGLLVSNAGGAAMGAFNRVPVEALSQMIVLNVLAQMELTHAHTSALLAEGRTGGVILVGSTAGLQGTPLGASYSGAKAYVLNLGEALNYELMGTGIHVSVLVPGSTDTPSMTARDDVDLMTVPMPIMDVEPVVRGGLRAVARNKAVYIPGLMNRIVAGPIGRRLLSRGMSVSLQGRFMSRCAPERLMVRPKTTTKRSARD